MPTIREFEKKASKAGTPKTKAVKAATAKGKSSPARKRRPGRDTAAPASVKDSQGEHSMHDDQPKPPAPGSPDTPPVTGTSGGFSADAETGPLPGPGERPHENRGGFEDDGEEKLRLEFACSEFLRMKAPKAFELAETVADEWMKDGRFEGLPVGHPVAQMAAQAALLQAKKIEKKLEEKGVFAIAKMGVAYAKSKLGRR